MKEYTFQCEMKVRDYECDMQGRVNNAVYQNYLEHVRHEYFREIGIDWKKITLDGIHFVAIRVELDYRHSLFGGEKFRVGLDMARISRLRLAFYQDIHRSEDDKLILQGKTIWTALNAGGRPGIPKEIMDRLPLLS